VDIDAAYMNDFRFLRGAGLVEGGLAPGSYAVAGEVASPVLFRIRPESAREAGKLEFVFGFCGVGMHYRLGIDFKRNWVSLFLQRDGSPVYLHHMKVDLPPNASLVLSWRAPFIRVFVNDRCCMQVCDAAIDQGAWGFHAVTRVPVQLPEVDVQTQALEPAGVMVFGDGFSNPRWSNKNYHAWPDLLWGHRNDYYNACVAACNSQRLVRLLDRIDVAQFQPAEIWIAAGNDDLIEKTSMETCLDNLKKVFERLSGESSLKVMSVWPGCDTEMVERQFNRELKQLVGSYPGVNFYDIYDFLRGLGSDVSGPVAQVRIARHLISSGPVGGAVLHEKQPVQDSRWQLYVSGLVLKLRTVSNRVASVVE
jgi:hypothetical protein